MVRAHTRERTNERTNERTRTFVGTNESTSERGVKKPALDVSACDGARAGSFKKGGGCVFRAEVCRAQGLGGKRNETKRNASRAVQNIHHHTKVQKKRGTINYDDPAGIRTPNLQISQSGTLTCGRCVNLREF